MKNALRTLICFLALGFSGHEILAQDPHFNQYNVFASQLNPALVGNYNGSYRMAAIYRQQWTAALGQSDGYRTVGADVDVSLLEGYLRHSKLAFGLGFINDRSGTAGLDYLNANISVAYHQGFGKDDNHHLSIGLQGGYIQKRIESPTFSDQFVSHNQTLISTQDHASNGFSNGDLSAGLYWKSNFRDRIRFGIGAAMYHILQPSEGVLLNTAVSHGSQYRRYTIDFNLEAFLGKKRKMSITPEFLFMQQGPSQEITPGLFWAYYFQTGFRKNNSFHLGVRYRIGDAVVPMAMIEFRNLRVGMGYDINVSDLNTSTHNRGAFEVSISFVGESIKSFKGSRSLPSRRF